MILTRQLASAIALAFPLLTFAQEAKTDVDPPVMEHIDANTEIRVVAPTNTWYGTRGLSQTGSAEALGMGRLIFGLNGSFYQQQKAFLRSPNKDAKFFTGIGSIAFGLNRQVDAFASITGFGSTNYNSQQASGPGTVGAGVQGTLPFAQSAPVRMAAQVGIYQGLTNNPIDTNYADGYSYFEARTGLDFMGKLIQSLVLGNEDTGFKLHFNEGVITSAEDGTDGLLLLSTGAQVNMFNAVLGLELHSRSPIETIEFGTDPFWMTPSVQFRSAYDINLSAGADIALSGERNDAAGTRALEPFRLFAGLTFTLDTEAGARAEAKAKAQREAGEKNSLKNSNRSLKEQAREDSLAQIRQKAASDSAAAAAASRNSADSLSMANKARQDSIALAESQKNLALEKSKRSDAEKQLLSTGLLLMDAVYFETNKTDISINSKPYLNIIAKMLTKYPKLRIEVAGHTDDVGSDAHNQTLSQGRSESVANYMSSVAPELRDVLTARGYGESMPKADNKTADGRKLNRRTELQVLNKEVLKEYNP
ncbi:MAG: OmpA family protein [Fibrobacteres bacterium]|nr:OmpA family protein [Fibrobacterota bacterium]